MKKWMKLAGAATVGALALSTGMSGVAAADPAEDVATLLGNLPAAIDEVVEGLQAAVDAYNATGSFVEASNALEPELMQTIDALVAGTEQFGALGGFGSTILINSLAGVVEPVLAALDDPSLATAIIDGEDIAQLLENLVPAVSETLHPGGANVGLICAIADTLRGNLTDGLFASTSLSGCTIQGVATGYLKLIENVDNASIQSTLGLVLVVAIAVPSAVDPHLLTLEENLAPLFEALAPVTGPIADAIAGIPPLG